MTEIVQRLVQDDGLHAKWLNTLSFMENAGARKISACEHPDQVNLIQLKHAAEEHRHAYYLKKQIAKIGTGGCNTYTNAELLAAKATRYYLHSLDIQCARYLKKQFHLKGAELKYAAYLFVTYVIEVRADLLYPVYQEVLTAADHKVMVRSIIVEEAGHLEEMIVQLKQFNSNWEHHARVVMDYENVLFEDWMKQIEQELHNA